MKLTEFWNEVVKTQTQLAAAKLAIEVTDCPDLANAAQEYLEADIQFLWQLAKTATLK